MNNPPGSSFYAKNESYRKLLAPLFTYDDKDVQAFLAEKDDTAPYPEGLIYECSCGINVRSKSENLIADYLYSMRVPFKYESPVTIPIDGRMKKVYPDFKLYDVEEKRIKIWEHMGLIDNPEYANRAFKKIDGYIEAGYYPDDNLILTFESAGHKLSSAEIEEKIKKHFPWADYV